MGPEKWKKENSFLLEEFTLVWCTDLKFTEVNLLIREHELVVVEHFLVVMLNGSDVLSVVEQFLYKLLFGSITGNGFSMSGS